jgi:hypothetical protein
MFSSIEITTITVAPRRREGDRVMPRILALVTTVVLLSSRFALAQTGTYNLSGIYDVYRLDNPNVRITGMVIRQAGQSFTISGI